MPQTEQDHYRALGVERGAGAEEIKRAYRRLARRYHPDVNPGDARAEAHFKRISEAYETLSDPAKRATYDRFSDLGAAGFGGFGRAGSDAAFAGSAGFRDLFAEVLRAAAGGRDARPSRGTDLHTTVEIDFEDAVRGVTVKIPIEREAACSSCSGSGSSSSGAKAGRCPGCNGTGSTRGGLFSRAAARPCTACSGTGAREVRPCAGCTGRGLTRSSETIAVKVPAGVDNGSRVRVSGHGNAGPRGTPAGDLFVITRVRAHERWQREGDNLYLRVPVSIAEAALGTKITVPTVDGPAVIKVPQGTQSGQRFRLKDRGVPSLRTGGRGDQFVEVYVVVPRLQDERSREIMRELARLNPEDPRKGLFD